MSTTKKTILILDAETRAALATVRSLGAAGYTCFTASHHKRSIASSSKYSKAFFHSPDIRFDSKAFLSWLLEIVSSQSITTILPMTDATVESLGEHEEQLKALVEYPVISRSILHLVQDKYHLIETAKKVGLRVPKTIPLIFSSPEDTNIPESLKNELTYPFMLKPRSSVQTSSRGGLQSPPRKVINSDSDFSRFVSGLPSFPLSYLAQELIPGSGTGIFCLYKNNRSILDFAHRRVLEKPPEGGVSVLSQAITPPEDLLKSVHLLLNEYSWEGVAMTEFKITPEGKPYLMEINPRFWGSLQLAIDAGYDFPRSLLDSEYCSPERNTNTLLRWELGTLDHMIIRYKEEGFIALIKRIINNDFYLFKRGVRGEILRLSDPKPFITEFRNYFSRV